MSMNSPAAVADAGGVETPRVRREVLEALSGLMLGMFVAILSSTVVSSSLPRIIGDLGGGQSAYTWVVTSSLLALTISTPIWGKLADLLDRKTLVQISLVIFTVGSVLAGLSKSTSFLIACRVIQGIAAGGLTALVQIVIADLISPRERGRYAGILGGIMGVGTAGGPLLGGLITDSVGWRWNFYVGVPLALIAIVLLQKTLHLPARPPRKVRIDILGATLLAGGISSLLIWVSLAGHQFAWGSSVTALMVGGSIALLGAAVLVERRAPEPILPLRLFRDRTVVLSLITSVAVGVALFGTSVFLSQYMQLARGKSPTESGLLTLPLVVGSLVSSIVIGGLISRTGQWKRYMVTGSVLLLVGITLMGTMRYDTSFVLLAAYMALVGLGIGMVMQNLVLVVQNVVPAREMGAASSSVAFFRSLGGAVGVAALGAVLSSRIGTLTGDGFARIGLDPGAAGSSGSIPVISQLPPAVRTVVESAYGEGVGDVFLVAAPLALIAVIMIALLPNRPLGALTAAQQLQEERSALVPEPAYGVPTPIVGSSTAAGLVAPTGATRPAAAGGATGTTGGTGRRRRPGLITARNRGEIPPAQLHPRETE